MRSRLDNALVPGVAQARKRKFIFNS